MSTSGPAPRPIDAVLFDFSGTLFAVEPPTAWIARAAAPLGLQIAPAEAEELAERLIGPAARAARRRPTSPARCWRSTKPAI